MGGVAGHMLHPYEDLTLSVNDLLSMIESLFLKDADCYEKVDGLNIHFRISDSNVMFARNKTDIALGGMSQEDLFERFADHPVGQAFMTASAVIKLWIQRQGIQISEHEYFGWVNCEIVDLNALNILNYTVSNALGIKIVLHGSEYRFDTLLTYADDISGNVLAPIKYKFFSGPHNLDAVNFHKNQIKSLFYKVGIESTVRDFLWTEAHDYLNPRMQFLRYGDTPLSAVVADKISGKMSPEDSKKFLVNFRRYCIENSLTHVYNAVYSLCCSKNIRKTRSRLLRPLELAWHNVSSHLLNRQKSHLISTCKGEEMNRIKENLHQAKKEVNGMEWQWHKLGPIDLIDQGIEGIVFEHTNGKKYKMTGQFAPINQILGALKFGR